MHLNITRCREFVFYMRHFFRGNTPLTTNRNLLMKVSLLSLLLTVSTVLAAHTLSGQHLSRIPVSVSIKQGSLKDALKQLEKQSAIRFTYKSSDVAPFSKVAASGQHAHMESVLQELLNGTGLQYEQIGNTVIIKKTEAAGQQTQTERTPATITKALTQNTVSGKVADENGRPLPGVTVREKGYQHLTNTTADGTFSLVLSSRNSVITFSFIGYQTRELTYDQLAAASFQLVLQPDFGNLDEVTVIGYGTTSRRVSTGSTAGVTSAEITAAPINDPLAALQGRIAGLEVASTNGLPGSAFTVRLRGLNSIGEGKNEPLYIIDGIPYFSESLNMFNGDNGAQSPLSGINPADIERIDVLKDADATAIYGSRGANGVILITTKKGKAGKTQVAFNLYTGAGKVTNKVDMLSTAEYLDLRREAFRNSDQEPTEENAPDLTTWSQTDNSNWQDRLIGNTASLTEANVSISGGSELTTFLLSGTLRSEGTVQPGDNGYKKGSGMLTLDHHTADRKFGVLATVNYTSDFNNALVTDITQYYNLPPNMPVYDENGYYYWYGNDQNPIAFLERRHESRNQTLLASGVIRYSPLKGLDLTANIGYNKTVFAQVQMLPLTSFNPASVATNMGLYGNSTNTSYNIEPQAKYSFSHSKGTLDLLVGGTWQRNVRDGRDLRAEDFTSDAQLHNISAANRLRSQNFAYTDYLYQAVFGRATYNWDNRYIVNASFRTDGSSRFGPNKRFGNFGAVGAAWVFAEEAGVKESLPFLSFGKLRGSYGTTGNDQIGNYRYMDTWGFTVNPYDNIVGLNPTRLANPDYRWERNRKLEGGLELGFLDNRLSLNVNHYFNRSDNQLILYTLSPQTGFDGYTANMPALVENSGWEFELSTVNVQTDNFEWSTSGNLTISRNKLAEYPDFENSGLTTQYMVGHPLEIVFGYKFTGVNAETGIPEFEDMDGDGTLNPTWDDQYIMGNRMPSFFGGLNNILRYKNLQLNFLLQFVKQEGEGLNYGYPATAALGIRTNFDRSVLNRWTSSNTNTDIPRAASTSTDPAYAAYNSYYRHSDAMWVDASFIRLKNFTVNYDLTSALPMLKAQRLGIYVQGQNLFTITNYDGFDPETRGRVVPPIRYYTAGIRFTY